MKRNPETETNGSTKDFILRNGGPRDSLDFLFQHQRANALRKYFGIDLSNELVLDKRQKRDFRICLSFLRERIWWLGAGETNCLIDFVSLYTNTEKKPVFAQLSRLVLKEVCGRGKNFKELAASAEAEPLQKTFQTLFYFWAATVHHLFPVKRLAISDAFDRSPTFARAKQHSELALGRAMTALMMANKIVIQRENLAQMGVSPFQQEIWLRFLLNKPRAEWPLTAKHIHAGKIFRLYIPTDPRTSLEKERIDLLFAGIPKIERLSRLQGILDTFIVFLNEAEETSSTKPFDQRRIDCVRWLRQRTLRERTKILRVILDNHDGISLKNLFAPEEFRPSVKFGGKRKYHRREGLKEVIPPVADILAEFLEGRLLPEIMFNSPPAQSVAREFVEKGLQNSEGLRPALLALLSAAQKNIERGDCRLNKREILVALYASTKRPFDGPIFMDTFRKLFFEDLPGLDGMLE